MNNQFSTECIYNAMQTMAPSALANNHCPIHYTGLKYIQTHKDENGVIEHEFDYEGEPRFFDDAFTNNGKSFDNSMIIVEAKR